MKCSIRPMRPADYAAVRAVWEAAGLSIRPAGRDTEVTISAQLRQFSDTYLVAERDGRIVGVVLGTHDGRKGWINRLAVHPDYQRQGLARRLVEACEAALAAHGIEIFAALVEPGHDASEALMRAAGYDDFGPIKYYRKLRRPGI